MTSPVVQADRYVDVLVDIERLRETLGEDINDVIVTVRAVVKFNPESALPLLRLQHPLGIRSMKDETLEIQLSYSRKSWSQLYSPVEIVANAISALKKPDFGVEIRPY